LVYIAPLQAPRVSAQIFGGSTSGLTHFRGKAAIASKGNAALRLSLGTPTARHPYPELRERRSRETLWRITSKK